jgi:hypothetical protein
VGWQGRSGIPVLAREQVFRRAEWLSRTLAEAPGLPPAQRQQDRVSLKFRGERQAGCFHRALLAENVAAELRGERVVLEVAAWFTPADVRSLALAATKVAHYLSR